jgi:hypothetical protein
MKFTEEKLEQAVIDLFKAEGYKHLTGEQNRGQVLNLGNIVISLPPHGKSFLHHQLPN